MKKLEKLQLEADPGSIDYSDERYMTVQNLFKIENKINNLIDLVNSQQEAIERLEKVITRDTLRIVTDDIVDALSQQEPVEMVSKARYAEKLGIHDTHRTVTLRIPKGMTIGKAVWNTLDQRDENCLYRLLEQSDTDLQKALDEVQPNE